MKNTQESVGDKWNVVKFIKNIYVMGRPDKSKG